MATKPVFSAPPSKQASELFRSKPTLTQRTVRHELQIVKESIDLLKSDVAKAEANRLVAGRLRDERHCAWKEMESQLTSIQESTDENKLMTEFLLEDIETLQNRIEAQQWNCRFSAQSETRIRKLEQLKTRKQDQLSKATKQVESLRLKLERFMTLRKNSVQNRIGEFSSIQDGAGDVSDLFKQSTTDYSCHFDLENGNLSSAINSDAHWQKPSEDDIFVISSQYEDACQERESCEEDIKFIGSRLVDLRQKQENVSSNLNLCEAELKLKKRQYREAQANTERVVEKYEIKKAENEANRVAFEEAEESLVQADESVRTLKKLLRQKIEERSKLEEKAEREAEIEELKRFSSNVTETLPEPFGDHYPCLSDPLVVKYLQSLKSASAQSPSPFWTDEVENLSINFKERVESAEDKQHEDEKHQNSDEENQQFYQKSLATAPYLPPPTQLHYSIRNPKPISKTTFSLGSRCQEYLRRTVCLEDGIGSLTNLFLKVSDAIAYGVGEYPKLVVSNGVMYNIRDRRSEPETIFGPLNFEVWRRHRAQIRTFSLISSNGRCGSFLRPTISASLLKEP